MIPTSFLLISILDKEQRAREIESRLKPIDLEREKLLKEWESLIQYTGRIHRKYPGIEKVIIRFSVDLFIIHVIRIVNSEI